VLPQHQPACYDVIILPERSRRVSRARRRGRNGVTGSMASAVQLKSGAVSITGNFRENNEDKCLVDAAGRYFLVADGMGGQSAGEKASELAIELISERLSKLDFKRADEAAVVTAIDEAVSHANMEIMALGELDPSYHNMGTTIAFVIWSDNGLYCGGIGDSRVYLLRRQGLEQLTTDHSLTQALLDAGTISEEEAAIHRYKNVLYRYLGTKEGSNGTKPRRLQPEAGDRFVICSDGVTDGIDDGEIARILSENADPQQAAAELVNAAEAGGSRDNITCVVVFVG
jgi:PPM family protein phosphatase